ncbi:MAG: hypothetical protein ABI036_14095 [Fibrobacteria bacterium]
MKAIRPDFPTLLVFAISIYLAVASFAKAEEDPKWIEVSAGIDGMADSLSLVYASASVYYKKLVILNYYELKYSHEWVQLFITDHPEIQKLNLNLGYQYYFHLWHIFVPATVGISNGFVLDRGKFIRSVQEDSTCFLCHEDKYYEKRRNYSVGWFAEVSPTIMINDFFFGLKINLNQDTHFMTAGAGITIGLPLHRFVKDESEIE